MSDDRDDEGEEEAVDEGHGAPPKIRTRLGAVEVEVQGGPEDESVDDIRDDHDEKVREAVSNAHDLESGDCGGFD